MAGRRPGAGGRQPRTAVGGPGVPGGLRGRWPGVSGHEVHDRHAAHRYGVLRRGLGFLGARPRVLARLGGWSALESAQTFLVGYAPARALDAGFLAGRTDTGLAWLGVAALGVLAGAIGTARVYRAVADLVEPLRDGLVTRVVERGVREAEGEALSRLTQQVEIARDTFAGLVLVSRSFVFTALGALVGLFSLAPALLLVVVPPLVAGLGLFLASLRPLARRQESFLTADEALAGHLGVVCAGLRDITAAGAEERTAAEVGERVEAELAAARSLARWSVLRVASLAVGGQLPVLLLLAAAPLLLSRGVTPGALVGALAYVTQSLLPALRNLIHGLGTSGSRLAVVLRRLAPAQPPASDPGEPVPPRVRPAGPPPQRAPAAALTVSCLTFAYGPAAAPVIEDLDLVLAPGSHLAVVGPSGIGKSTLTALVAGLLTPRHGTVHVHGHPVPGPAAAAHRVLIPQEAYVHSGTLAENLGHLRPDPLPERELLAAAEAVGLAPLLDALGGPEAPVDPGALSAGERQLIALTRAYLSPAPLALLDEATCHLDAGTEERAERAFAARPGGTLVVVAHRIGSARRAGRVLLMDGPRTEYGTHEELVRRSPAYRALAGDRPPRSQPALAARDADRVDPVAGPGLAGDGRHVVAHRAVGEVQAPRDLRDGGALGGQG
ncbi:ATP-binding cassette domain-containing protein [Streptomyces sp. NPDC089424]|uniref:ATP-binding cassette domain-containing protein n=1 Tax=Streptomyces sp. NPDC089424 TaxID=3365917 RepID=UPI0038070197